MVEDDTGGDGWEIGDELGENDVLEAELGNDSLGVMGLIGQRRIWRMNMRMTPMWMREVRLGVSVHTIGRGRRYGGDHAVARLPCSGSLAVPLGSVGRFPAAALLATNSVAAQGPLRSTGGSLSTGNE